MKDENTATRRIYEKAVQLLKESNTLALSVMDEEGYPKIYAMEKVISVNLDTVIFITKKDSNKVCLLNKNNKCCVEIHTEDDMVSLKGNVDIVESREENDQCLPNEYIRRLEISDSERYCILIFHAIEADLYIEGEINSVQLKSF